MLRSISNILTALAAMFFVALLVLAVPSFFDPEFEVFNNASEAVSVVATWRNNEKNIGRIEPGSWSRFSVNDEAAMTFTVLYNGGRKVETAPLYFSRGFKVIVTISADGVETRYDHEAKDANR